LVLQCGGKNELYSPSVLGLKGRRWTPCTGCREVEAGEREFPWGEGQLACQSERKTASFCSRGTTPTDVKTTLHYQKNEKADVTVDASLNRLNPLTRIFGDLLKDLRHHFRHEHLLVHLPANDGTNFRGDDRFLLDVDAYAK